MQVIFCFAMLRDGDGRLTGYAAVAHDITERKNQEKTRQLLVGELKHRMKNTLAIAQAMASQTLQGSAGLADFLPNLNGACGHCPPRTSVGCSPSTERGAGLMARPHCTTGGFRSHS